MSKIINLTEDMVMKKEFSFKRFIVKWTFGLTLAAVAGIGAVEGGKKILNIGYEKFNSYKVEIMNKLTTVEVVKEYVKPTAVPTEELIRKVSSDYGLNPVILLSLVEQESNFNPRALRFEEKLTKRFSQKKNESEDQFKMRLTSIGLAQVIPAFHADRCKVTWDQLLDRLTNLECAALILKTNLDSAKSTSNARRLRTALRMYNGSGEDAERYADEVLSKIAENLLEGTNL